MVEQCQSQQVSVASVYWSRKSQAVRLLLQCLAAASVLDSAPRPHPILVLSWTRLTTTAEATLKNSATPRQAMVVHHQPPRKWYTPSGQGDLGDVYRASLRTVTSPEMTLVRLHWTPRPRTTLGCYKT